MNNYWNIDTEKTVADLTPPELRTPIYTALFKAFTVPFVILQNSLLAFIKDKIYELSITSQICYIRKMLNDAYDPQLRRIYIQNKPVLEPVIFYRSIEEKPVIFYNANEDVPVIFNNNATLGADRPNATIFIPLQLQPATEAETNTFLTALRGKVDKHIVYSKIYDIEWIS